MKAPSLINVPYLQLITKITALSGFVDPIKHIMNDRVYIYGGTEDTIVVQGEYEYSKLQKRLLL